MTNVAFRLSMTGLLLLALAEHAHAHRVNVFAYAENGEVKVEAYFSGGGKAKNCKVAVFGADDQKRMTLITDENGELSFTPKQIEDLRFVVTTGDGHRAECSLKASKMRGAGPPAPAETEPRATAASDPTARPLPNDVEQLKNELRSLREQVRELKKAQSDISTRDVIAGLAFILGLTALAAHVWRKRSRTKRER